MSSPARVTTRVLKDIDPKKLDELRKRLVGNLVVRVGIPAGKHEEDGTPVAMIAAVHEFGSPEQGIPERPFLRITPVKQRMKYARLNRINLVKMLRGQMAVETALGQLGEMAKGDVQQEIRNGNFAPLKAETIRRKGSSKPLIDSGQMIQSVSWELGDKSND